MNRRLAILTLPMLIMACAGSPSYDRASSEKSYGYSDTKLENDRYRVQYRLRGENVGKAQDFALLRAAELTMANGNEWFRVVDRSSNTSSSGGSKAQSNIRAERVVTRECGLLGCRTTSAPAYSAGATIGTYERDTTVVIIEIRTGKGRQPHSDNVYDASELAGNIRARM